MAVSKEVGKTSGYGLDLILQGQPVALERAVE